MYLNLDAITVLCLLNIVLQGNSADMVKMKMVEEPKTYSWQQPNANAAMADQSRLKMRIKPSPFNGPLHLQALDNRCFNKTIGKYRYNLCPFSNLTQIEEDVYWNPYMGVLGVWNGWVVDGNKFVEMKFVKGDQCGVAPRESRVVLSCGMKNEILSVSEYGHCKYMANFSTPLVCHKHSMLVYPTLDEGFRHAWDVLHTELHNEEITLKGYNVELNKLLGNAGLLGFEPTSDSDSPPVQMQLEQDPPAESKSEHPFNDLHTCNQQYEDLKNRLEELEKLQNEQSQEANLALNALDFNT